MGTDNPKPLSHGGISEAAAVATYGSAASASAVQPPEPVVEPETEDDPWDSMVTHAAIDAFLMAEAIEKPVGWDSRTIQQKKDWLDENA